MARSVLVIFHNKSKIENRKWKRRNQVLPATDPILLALWATQSRPIEKLTATIIFLREKQCFFFFLTLKQLNIRKTM